MAPPEICGGRGERGEGRRGKGGGFGCRGRRGCTLRRIGRGQCGTGPTCCEKGEKRERESSTVRTSLVEYYHYDYD